MFEVVDSFAAAEGRTGYFGYNDRVGFGISVGKAVGDASGEFNGVIASAKSCVVRSSFGCDGCLVVTFLETDKT